MIKSTVEKIRNRFHFMLVTSVASVCMGFYLSDISKYINKLNTSVIENQPKLQNVVQGGFDFSKVFSKINNIPPVYKSVFCSLFLGVSFGFIVYNSIHFMEKENIKRQDKISNIYSFHELLSAEFTTEDENVAGRKRTENIIE
jgi:xanthine/uracil/vitamin C permease (AzgA family)